MAEHQPTEQPSLLEQGEGVVSDVKGAVLHAARHLEALYELFVLELREYGRHQMRRMVAMLVGAVLLGVAYLLLCMLAVAFLAVELGLMTALVIVIAFNALAGGVAVVVAAVCKPSGIAPATGQEIKDDIQCIKLYLKGKGRS